VDHLSTEQLSTLRGLLEDERDRLRTRVAAVASAAEEEEVERQDGAAREADRQQEIRLARHAQARLGEVEAALGRMDDGRNGECEETGEPIPFGRLQIEPTTRYTVEAAETLGQAGGRDDGSREDPGAY
jgi:DnaK suppressor protein